MAGDDERRFDEREAGKILARVAELGERRRDDAKTGLTRAELEDVAAELGYERALVARASAELARPESDDRLWGGPTRLRFEARVAGAPSQRTLEHIYDALRRAFGVPGEVSESGGATLWSAGAATSRGVFLTVREVDGETLYRLEEQMPVDARASSGVGAVLGFFIASLAMIPLKVLLGKPLLMLMILPLFVTGALAGWAVGRARWRLKSAERRAQLEDVFSDILELASAGAEEAPALPAGEEPE